jgi:hypothetical protein
MPRTKGLASPYSRRRRRCNVQSARPQDGKLREEYGHRVDGTNLHEVRFRIAQPLLPAAGT